MEWTEIQISIPAKWVDEAGAIANMSVPYGIYIEDYSNLEADAFEIASYAVIDEELLKKDKDNAIIHIYISPERSPNEAVSFISKRLEAAKIPYTIKRDKLNDEDWADSWKKYYKPIPIGEKLIICPAWIKLQDTKGRKVILIEPGAAFGSGTHESTQLSIKALEHTVKDGDLVLDIGCGSGILSIAALHLGASETLAVDIDRDAVKTARANGELNGFFEPLYTVVCGSLSDKANKKYDIIVANIVADVIISFCNDAFSLLNDGGTFISSGIIENSAGAVESALVDAGFKIDKRHIDNGWVCLIAKKKK